MTLHHAQHVLTTKGIQHRIGFLFRCLPCGDREVFGPLAARCDRALLSVAQRVCHHARLSQRAIDIAFLPMYLGGLGYRRWMDLADAAFLASYSYARKQMVSLFPALRGAFPDPRHADFEGGAALSPLDRDWAAAAAYLRLHSASEGNIFDLVSEDTHTLHHLQKKLTEGVDLRRANDLVTALRRSKDARARQHLAYHLSARADRYSLCAVPHDEDTTLSNRTLQVAVSLRLLEPILHLNEDEASTLSLQCPCCLTRGVYLGRDGTREEVASKDDVDHWGYHALRCFGSGNATRRTNHHDRLVLKWESLLRHAGFTNVMHEPSGYLLLSEKRPDVILDGAARTFLDVRTCDPLLRDATGTAPTMFERCVDVPGTAAVAGARLKDNAWKGLVEAQGDVFVPLCHEMGGIMGDAALDLLSKAAARYSPITAQQNAFKCFWLTRLHLTNIRGVAETVQANLPFYADSPPPQNCNGAEFFIHHPSPLPVHLGHLVADRRPASAPLPWHQGNSQQNVISSPPHLSQLREAL